MNVSRLGKVFEEMSSGSMDLGVISPGANLKYLLGMNIDPHERTFMLVLKNGGGSSFALPLMEEEKLKAATSGSGTAIYSYADQDGPLKAVVAALDAGSIKLGKRPRIGAEFLHMRLKEHELIKAAIGEFDVMDLDGVMLGMRAIKDSEEISCLRRAAEIVDIGIEAAKDSIRPGVSENYVAEEIEKAMMAAGADSVPFNSVLSGPNAALPHGRTSSRRIEDGELVLCDIGAGFRGYFGDITRTIAAGRPPERMIGLFEAVYAANKAGRQAARPGMTGEELDSICRAEIVKAGFGEFFIHRTGHGLGLEVHEEPYIVYGNRKPLLPGMVFTIEPGAYIPGLGGVRIEDDVLITEKGAEIMTKQPRELILD